MNLRYLLALMPLLAALPACTTTARQTITVVNGSSGPVTVAAFRGSVISQARPVTAPGSGDHSGFLADSESEFGPQSIPAGGSVEFPIAIAKHHNVPLMPEFVAPHRVIGFLYIGKGFYGIPGGFYDEAMKWDMRSSTSAGRLEYRGHRDVTLATPANSWKLRPQ